MIQRAIDIDGVFYTSENQKTNFRVDEFRCKCGECTFSAVSKRLIDVLQAVRMQSGPLHVVSGIRCEAHNLAIGGAPNSYHMPREGVGMAADVASRVLDPAPLAILGARHLGPGGGIGLYSSWVHFDSRETRAFWEGT